MQLANSTLKLSAIAVLIAHGALAIAQIAPPAAPVTVGPVIGAAVPMTVGAPPVAAGTAAVEQRAATAGAVKAVAIGKADDATGAAGTLKELETLQREVYLGELRAKVRGLNAPDKSAAAPAPATATNVAAAPATPMGQPAMNQPFNATVFNAPAPAYGDITGEPSAQLVSVIVSGGRARADVMDNGITKTVKEGDRLGDWSVVSIAPTGVKVEKTVFDAERGGAPGLVRTPLATAVKSKRLAATPATVAVPAGRTISAMLKPYQPPPLVQANTVGAAFVPAVVPPLPSQIKFPDSASIGAATAVQAK